MISREFNLYLHAGHSIPMVINVNQYDHGEQWLFKLFNSDGTKYVPSSGAIVGIKSDNLGIINSGSVDTQGRVVINETQQMTAAVGKAVFELVIDDGTHGTANFVVLVEPKPGDNADLSETDISMIEQAVEAASTIKPYGSPLVASTVAGMTDHEKVYVYVGSETGYTSGNWYYWDGSAWTSGGVYNSVAVQTDTTLTLSGVAADAKKTGDEISDLKSQIAQSGGLKDSIKNALLQIASKVAYIDDDGQDYYDALYSAFYNVEVLSISAVFAQGTNVIYTHNTLDDLKQYLTVTANYDNGTTANVVAYTLSGELSVGTRVITVTYGGKTTSFTVNISAGVPIDTYTMYDYIQTKVNSGNIKTTKAQRIETASYTDLNELSVDFYYEALTGHYVGGCIFGRRTASGSENSYAFYAGDGTLGYHLHGNDTSPSLTSANDEVHHVKYTNTASSPSALNVDDEANASITWANTNSVANVPFALLMNPTDDSTSFTLFYLVRIGRIRFTDLSGTLIGDYFPCVRIGDNVIGIYDVVEQSFHTCQTVSNATVGNSAQRYIVGNWE